MIFKKKARIPRKEKKRRAKLLNPKKKIKHNPYPGLNYRTLEKVIQEAFFGPEAEAAFKRIHQRFITHGVVFIDAEKDYTVRKKMLTPAEILERYGKEFPETPEGEGPAT